MPDAFTVVLRCSAAAFAAALSLGLAACTEASPGPADTGYTPWQPVECTPISNGTQCPAGCVEFSLPRSTTMTGCCDFDPADWSTTESAGVGCYDPYFSPMNPATFCYVNTATNVTYGTTQQIPAMKPFTGFEVSLLPACP